MGGFRRSIMIGAALGLLIAVVAFGYLAWQANHEASTGGAEDVLVVLALPDEEGVVLPRVIERVSVNGTESSVISLDPLADADISGTSYTQLRDAYPFGGGAGLAIAVAAEDPSVPSYVVVDAAAWRVLVGATRLKIDVPEHMEVFDGAALTTFEAGIRNCSADQVIALFKGAEYLTPTSRAALRDQVGVILRELLVTSGSSASVKTDLSTEEYSASLAIMGDMR